MPCNNTVLMWVPWSRPERDLGSHHVGQKLRSAVQVVSLLHGQTPQKLRSPTGIIQHVLSHCYWEESAAFTSLLWEGTPSSSYRSPRRGPQPAPGLLCPLLWQLSSGVEQPSESYGSL